jgi:hypothetical protein
LEEVDGVTTMASLLVFENESSRNAMFLHAQSHLDDPTIAIDGQQVSYDKLEDHLNARH